MSAADKLAALSAAERDTVLALLDEISRPLTVRELDVAFAKAGWSRTTRRPMVKTLHEGFTVVALSPL